MKLAITAVLFFGALQTQAQVSGKVVADNNRPVPFAHVLLLNSIDTIVLKTALTNENGFFQIEYPGPGKYLLRAGSVGYHDWTSPFFQLSEKEKTLNFDTITMQQDHQQLQAVVVRTEKPLFQQQAGGLVVNVQNSLLTKGSTALQVLERSPGVVIDHRNNSIGLNGKTGVMVMLNGKLMPMQVEQVVALLNSMSADDIEKIELLTTPPAKYDAGGNAGLINIVLKKNKRLGTQGNITLTSGYGRGEKANAGFNLSHNKKNVNLFGSYTFSHNKTYSELFITSTQVMPFLGGDVSVLFLDTTKFVRDSHDANLGIDLKINPKLTVGASVNYNHNAASGTTLNNAGYTILPDSLLQFTGKNKGGNRWNNLVGSVYLEKTIREGEKFNLDMDYLYFDYEDAYQVQSSFLNKYGEQAGENNNLFSPLQKGAANTGIQVGVLKMDYTKQLNKKIKLETGFKESYTKSSSVSGIQSFIGNAWTSSEATTNDIRMKENISAAYASVNVEAGPALTLNMGLRYEYSATGMHNAKTGATIADRKLSAFFPSLFLSKKINDNNELQLSYTKRVSRPSYNDLASFVGYSDPTAVYTGNPFLKPTITHNLKLGYNYKTYTFSLLFSRDINPIQRYQLSESPARDMLFISPQNADWQNTVNLQTNLPFKLNNWWLMNFGLVGGFRQFKTSYTLQSLQKKYMGYSLNFSQAFQLPKKYSIELSGWYNSLSYNGTTRVDGFGVLNLGIKKEFKNNGGSFQLSVADLLGNEIYYVSYGTITKEAFDIRSQVAVITESAKFPIIKLSYAWSFGTTGKPHNNANASTKEEMERARKN